MIILIFIFAWAFPIYPTACLGCGGTTIVANYRQEQPGGAYPSLGLRMGWI